MVIIATVKGDIHDIGKNLVVMMMKNYGFHVIDLGKDVDKEDIIRAAKEHGADVIGLSALMTTTMSYMKEVIKAVREEGLPAKVIVGGAAVTPEYAKEHDLRDNDYVDVLVEGIKPTKFYDVQIRVREDFNTEMHIDTDDANSTGLKNGALVKIIGK